MTIDIRITTLDPMQYGPEDEQLERALKTIGFVRRSPTLREVVNAATDEGYEVDFKLERTEASVPEVIAESEPADAPKRERGQPSPGKARRTKVEIAEDEAADKADAALLDPNEEGRRLQNEGTDEQPAISTTPEDRQDPANPEPADDEATAAADAADEAAETAAARGDNPTLTLEDIRNVLGKYQQAYGVEATMIDGPLVLSEVCGEGVVKVSQVTDDKVGAVIEALKKAGRENRFGRTAVAA